MISLRLPAADDLAELVLALLDGADHCEGYAPELADRRRAMADELGDALDALPHPIPMPDSREDHTP